MSKRSTNPFDDGDALEESLQASLVVTKRTSTNPFDFDEYSADKDINDDEDDDLSFDDSIVDGDDDDDDDMSFYEDCNQHLEDDDDDDDYDGNDDDDDAYTICRLMTQEETLPQNSNSTTRSSDANPKLEPGQTDYRDGGLSSTKRVAPLSFDAVPVVANPALSFSDMQTNRTDFISPLETAMINKVDHLKSQNIDEDEENQEGENYDNEEEAEDEDDNDGEKSRSLATSYLSVDWLRNLYSPRTGSKNDLLDADEQKSDENGKDYNGGISVPVQETPTKSSSMPTTDFDNTMSPLAEAKEVLERMENVSNSIFRVISAEKRKMSPVFKMKMRKPNRKRQLQKSDENKRVLKRIEGHPKDIDFTIDHRQAGSPWNRLIILEELGTASSWIVLLVPYVTFILSIFLDNDSGIWQTVSGPISAQKLCSELNSTLDLPLVEESCNFPLSPLPSSACSYMYKLSKDEGLLSHFGTDLDAIDYMHHLSSGVAFTSGPLTDVPVTSTFLFGDLMYDSLSSSSVSLVADGLVEYSTIVMQQRLGDDPEGDGEWFPVSISNPRKLSMVCHRDDEEDLKHLDTIKGIEPRWRCESPRNVDVLFSMMDSSFLTGGAIRVDTIISYYEELPQNVTVEIPFTTNITLPSEKSEVYSKHVEDKDFLSHADLSDPDALLTEIARSVSYSLTYPSTLKTEVLITVRHASFLLTIAFIVFWFWCIGISGFLDCCYLPLLQRTPLRHTEQEAMLKKSKEVWWWECPWMLFPERRYLLLLMISVLLVQNPVLIFMYFYPGLYTRPDMHIIADSIVGIGFHSVLCWWLCLCQGLRYHTASIARRRAKHQKEVLELKRARSYLSSNNGTMNSSYGSTTDHVTSYYDEFGDVDGPWNNLRLKHDPCGDGWGDFLIPKIFLLILGACVVISSCSLRFSCSVIDFEATNVFSFDAASVQQCRKLFDLASFAHMFILALWCILILRAAIQTGRVLKKEPFLSTRPAQLAYRIIVSILILGVLSFAVPLVDDIALMKTKWENIHDGTEGDASDETGGLVYRSSSEYHVGKITQTTAEVLINATIHLVGKRFPYSGLASSVEPGEMIYITACALVVAFIFLPSTSYILDRDNYFSNGAIGNGNRNQQLEENQRRDKRNFLNLSRYTHTWRVFPLPIERHFNTINPETKPKKVRGFQLNKNFATHTASTGRGIIYERNYIPLYCVEIALWLLECSWQTYYSTTEYKTDNYAPGIMNLDTLGLDLEADIYDESTDTRVFVASNIAPQVDGESDSMIVVAFRGTASMTNIKTDFTYGQEALPNSFIEEQAEYQFHLSEKHDHEAGNSQKSPTLVKNEDRSNKGFDALLRSAPITRQAFSCVHTGFLHSYSQIRDEIFETVLEVMERQISKALKRCSESDDDIPFVLPKIYVTGHSLGGSLAQLLALDISRNIEIKIGDIPPLQPPPMHVRGNSFGSSFKINRSYSVEHSSPSRDSSRRPALTRRNSFPPRRRNDETFINESVDFVHGMLSGIAFAGAKTKPRSLRPPIAVYTFGQPRLGNRAFARFYKANVPHTFRVVTEGDTVTMIPFTTFPSGVAFYKHAGLDVILDEGRTGNILVGPTVVETLFRFSKVRTKLGDHLLDVYRACLESAFTSEEIAEFYRTHGVNSRSIRSGYNVADVIPDWVTSVRARER